MHRRCAAPLCDRTRDLVTGRRAVTRAEILLLTSVHEDAMLGFIGGRREMAQCRIGEESVRLGEMACESGGCLLHAR